MTRFPLAPLLREAGGTAGLAAALGYSSVKELEHRSNLSRWREHGMSWRTADRLCCAINLHPSWVFGDAWFEDAKPAHGLVNGYPDRYRWGCRCEVCREAHQSYRKQTPGYSAALDRRRRARRKVAA